MPGKIFDFSEEKVGEVVATKVGDVVTVSTDNPAPGIVFTTSFDNLGISLKDGTVPAVPTAAR